MGTFAVLSSKGYLAFDYNQNEIITGRPAKTMHLHKVVRIDPRHRIYFAGEVSLPKEFSIRWMDCNAERVEIAGPIYPRGLAGPFTKCDVKIGSPTTRIGSAQCGDDVINRGPLHQIPELEISSNSKDDPPPITLEAPADTDHVYQLRRHLTQKLSARGLDSKTHAEVVELDQKGTILNRLVIYEYVNFEAAD
jgi:hypothetical protein